MVQLPKGAKGDQGIQGIPGPRGMDAPGIADNVEAVRFGLCSRCCR